MKLEFNKNDRFEPWCSVHDDPDIMADQKEKLGINMRQKIGELQVEAYKAKLGRIPSDKQIKRHARVTTWRPDKGAEVYTLMYRNKRVAAFTAPISRVVGLRYYLRFYFKNL